MPRILAAHAPEVSQIERHVEESNIDDVVYFDGSRLPEGSDGLLIYAPDGSDFNPDGTSGAVDAALSAGLPILASASGMHLLNQAMDGDAPKSNVAHSSAHDGEILRTPVFLAPGAKVSSMIGGSGWVSIECDHEKAVYQAGLAPGLMPSVIDADRVVKAFEAPGHGWVIGVQWDVFSANRMPRGFDAVWLAFAERVAGV